MLVDEKAEISLACLSNSARITVGNWRIFNRVILVDISLIKERSLGVMVYRGWNGLALPAWEGIGMDIL